jgi:MFS family permease
MTPPASHRARLADPLNRALLALGVTQILGWGTTVYALGVLGRPIVLATGWPPAVAYGGLTAALLAAAAISMPAGRWLDRAGGRTVMTCGSLIAAVSLALVAYATAVWAYLLAWALVGLGMRLCLYDAAFATLVQMAPARGRRAISLLTLPGGLASTILWPVGALLEQAYGWRTTLLVFALLNAGVCAPLHWFALARGHRALTADPATPATNSAAATLASPPAAPPVLQGPRRTAAMALFALAMAASAIVMGAMSVHLLPVLAATGIDARYAVLLASMKGVAQTVARLIELVFGKRLPAIMLARLTFWLMPLSFVVLLAGGASLVTASIFIALFGAANGLTTIVRGVVPLALFGPKGYGEVLGKVATPVLLANAIAPVAFAALTDGADPTRGVLLVLAAAGLAVIGMEVLARWTRAR